MVTSSRLHKIYNDFRLSSPEIKICSPNCSAEANKIYLEERYLPNNFCQRPCTDMKLKLTPQSKIESAENRVKFYLYTDIEVVSEKMPKNILTLVAELGGYLGLTVGVSLLDLKSLFSFTLNSVKAKLYVSPEI